MTRLGLDYISVQEIAAALGHSERTIRRWIQAGRMPHLRIGRRYLIRVTDYYALIGENSVGEFPMNPLMGYDIAAKTNSLISHDGHENAPRDVHVNRARINI